MVDKWMRMEYNTAYTIAEVAKVKSILPVWQLPAEERGFRRRARSLPERVPWDFAEYAEYCHREVERSRGTQYFLPPCAVSAQGGFYVLARQFPRPPQ